MIATYTPKPVINVFTETNIGKYVGTRHYDCAIDNGTNRILSPKIRIAVNRSFAKSLPVYWLSFRPCNKWVSITGLFKVGTTDFYKGDADHKRHLVLVRLTDNSTRLELYYFDNYYTKDSDVLLSIIEQIKSITN